MVCTSVKEVVEILAVPFTVSLPVPTTPEDIIAQLQILFNVFSLHVPVHQLQTRLKQINLNLHCAHWWPGRRPRHSYRNKMYQNRLNVSPPWAVSLTELRHRRGWSLTELR